jgi:hypothetical protein
MRSLFLIGSAAALSLFAVGCASAESVCESGIELACKRGFECATDQYKAAYGTEADCNTKLAEMRGCSAKKDLDELCTDANAGKKYDLGNASDCSDARKAQSCTDYTDPAKTPSVCTQICK